MGELYESRDWERYGDKHYRARRMFVYANADVAAEADSLWDAEHPTLSEGAYTPRCRRIRVKENWLPGVSRVIALYHTMRKPGKARVVIKMGSKAEERIKDLDNKPLSGPVTTADHLSHWKTVTGSSQHLRPTVVIIIETAFARAQGSDMLNLYNSIGKINSASVSKLGVLGATGTLKMLAVPMSHFWDQDDLWYANYAFEWYPGGWNSRTTAQECIQAVQTVPSLVLAADGTYSNDGIADIQREIVGKYYKVSTDTVTTAAAQSRRMYETANFSEFNGWIEW